MLKWFEIDIRKRLYTSKGRPLYKDLHEVPISETGGKPPHFTWYQYYWRELHWYLLFLYDTFVFMVKLFLSFPVAFLRIFMKENLKSVRGDIIVVTGAGGGLGRCISMRLAELGANIICWDINKDNVDETVSLIREKFPKVDPQGFSIDVTDRNAVLHTAKQIEEETGRVSMVVNCAQINPSRFLMLYNHKEINKMLDVNLRSHFWIIEAFLPQMKDKGKGHIVSVGSLGSRLGNNNMVPGCASFYGAHGLMEALRCDLRFYDFDYIKLTTAFPYYKGPEGAKDKPRIRFPNWMKHTSSEEAARCIVKAVVKNEPYVWIPFYAKYLHSILELLPMSAVIAFNDYMELACDPYDHKYNYKGERVYEQVSWGSSDESSQGSHSPQLI